MYIAILGRQPALGMAELEHLYGTEHTRWFSDQSALFDAGSFSIDKVGGSQKAGHVVAELPSSDWRQASTKVIQAYTHAWTGFDGKITLGISAYGFDISPREVQKTGIVLKQKLKKSGVSLRLIPSAEPSLNTATAHHNKLGLSNNKVELIIVRARNGRVVIAESTGSQNITALARRDQGRPKRDAFVGMLPPKLAQIMINLTVPSPQKPNRSDTIMSKHLQPESESASGPDLNLGAKPFAKDNGRKGDEKNVPRILDPFCGTGVVLQEAALMGYAVYGTDLSAKMVDYSRANLEWLASSHHITIDATVHEGDAMDTKWRSPIDAVVCEGYLGQPFSAPPSPAKLDQVKKNCDHIMTTFLKNIGSQIPSGTPLCMPAWRNAAGQFTRLPFITQLHSLGYTEYDFKHIKKSELLYYREDQIVARELLVIVKA
jgi:tRNA G10  N-methylase Trm11